MSEIPAPYNSSGPRKKDIERIADFMNGFLSIEMFEEIQYPENMRRPYDDMDDDLKQLWYEYTFHEIFRDAGMSVSGFVGRQLSRVELNLIKRRIINFFKQIRIEHER